MMFSSSIGAYESFSTLFYDVMCYFVSIDSSKPVNREHMPDITVGDSMHVIWHLCYVETTSSVAQCKGK